MLMDYASVGAFFLIAIVFVFGAMVAGWFVRQDKGYEKKLVTYECGEEPIGQAWFNFNPRFYIIALIYIVFDVEIAFIYPVASVFKRWVTQGSGVFALVEIATFISILLLGLAYVWAKGDLNWIRGIRQADRRGVQNVTTREQGQGDAEKAAGAATQES
ncbi:MAG TPA: NADH-quinone oxidoreductase subunit A [Polyangiaceae bacterium]|nr:NADH-quinone oxidoreductase subunit A [Polyangiaceae bacterium]